MGGESSFVDFRMPRAFAACCGVNLVDPALGVLLLSVCFFSFFRGL